MQEKSLRGANGKAILLALLVLILLLLTLAYGTAPTNQPFGLEKINPLGLLAGVLFALSFGLGLSLVLSALMVGALLLLCLYLFYRVALHML